MVQTMTTGLVLLVVLLHNVVRIRCASAKVSWFFRSKALENNASLTFNMGDTLNMNCKLTYSDYYSGYDLFAITKSSKAPSGLTPSYSASANMMVLNVPDANTLIYSDIDGVQGGYENFEIFRITAGDYSTNVFRAMNIGYLRPTDSGTYYCTAMFYTRSGTAGSYSLLSDTSENLTSGAVRIVVNTKPGQAHSAENKSSRLLIYSAVILSALKLVI